MAAHVLGLRLHALVGAFRGRDAARTVALVLAAALVTAALCVATLRLEDTAPRVASSIVLVLGTALVLGCFVGPLLAARPDSLDPRPFTMFGLSASRLVPSLLLSWLVSAPTLLIAAWSISAVAVWRAHGAATGSAVLAGVLAAVTGIAAWRLGRALGGLMAHRERPRQATALLVLGIALLAVPPVVFVLAAAAQEGFSDAVVDLADVLARAQVGAVFAFGATGETMHAVVGLLIALALVALWSLLSVRLATRPPRPLGRRISRALGWFRVLPPTAAGAVAARSIIYWYRDPRHVANLLIVPIAGVILIVPLLIVGVPLTIAAVVPVPIMAALYGWLAHNDLAYDSTALWMHVSAGVRGTADRAGRLVPVILVAVPVLTGAVLLAMTLNGRWNLLPALVGVCVSLFLCGLGLSSISSAAAPYPAASPGDGAFEQPQRTGGGIMQASVLFGAVALSAPVLWTAWLSLSQSVSHAMPTLWGGIGTGVAVLCGGILIGGAVFRRRGSRLMEFVEAA